MQFNRVKLSYRAQNLLGQLKRKTGLTPNILARFAICLSLKDPGIPNPDEFDERGSEIHPNVLFGEHEKMFMALMIKRLEHDRLDPKLYLHKQLRAHLRKAGQERLKERMASDRRESESHRPICETGWSLRTVY